MTRLIIFVVAAVLIFAAPTSATIPSFGTQTAEAIRSEFNDSDFKLSFADGAQAVDGGFSFSFVGVTGFPVLGGQDIQSSLALVTLQPNASLPTHSHPRAGETCIAGVGELEVFFVFEGLVDPRVVRNTLAPGDATVFPQGLVHGIKCVSDTPCTLTNIMHSADAGIIGISGF